MFQKCCRYLSDRHSRLLGQCQKLEEAVGAQEGILALLHRARADMSQAYEGAERGPANTALLPAMPGDLSAADFANVERLRSHVMAAEE